MHKNYCLSGMLGQISMEPSQISESLQPIITVGVTLEFILLTTHKEKHTLDGSKWKYYKEVKTILSAGKVTASVYSD